jgi:hypothetical protein
MVLAMNVAMKLEDINPGRKKNCATYNKTKTGKNELQ